MTPICANPSAPPPSSTKPILGRGTVARDWENPAPIVGINIAIAPTIPMHQERVKQSSVTSTQLSESITQCFCGSLSSPSDISCSPFRIPSPSFTRHVRGGCLDPTLYPPGDGSHLER